MITSIIGMHWLPRVMNGLLSFKIRTLHPIDEIRREKFDAFQESKRKKWKYYSSFPHLLHFVIKNRSVPARKGAVVKFFGFQRRCPVQPVQYSVGSLSLVIAQGC
ncbi:MAG: hypothetical protein IJB81_00525 [Clostridia bacterium]|nr:hypothetical protein [Clostridia bacterium]